MNIQLGRLKSHLKIFQRAKIRKRMLYNFDSASNRILKSCDELTNQNEELEEKMKQLNEKLKILEEKSSKRKYLNL